jgi:hypothetical protein
VKRLVSAALCAFLALPAGSALAYRDRGSDPDDRSSLAGTEPDIRSTVRTVRTTEGGRALRVKFRAYEDLGRFWAVTVYLDSRRGLGGDYLMKMSNVGFGNEGCQVYRRHHLDRGILGAFLQRGDMARCAVPVRTVHPTKRIRWRLHAPSLYSNTHDAAPDHGWYS